MLITVVYQPWYHGLVYWYGILVCLTMHTIGILIYTMRTIQGVAYQHVEHVSLPCCVGRVAWEGGDTLQYYCLKALSNTELHDIVEQ